MLIKEIIPRLYRATRHSLQGLRAAFQHEFAFQLEVYLSILIIPAALYLGHTGVTRALLLGSWFLVLLMELMNSALEAAVDRISKEHHELSGLAKDLGSAAVFLAIVNALIIWGLLLR